MIKAATPVYDEDRVSGIVGRLCETIDAVSLGVASWDLILQELGASFPGAMVSLHGQNLASRRYSFLLAHNLDPERLSSFACHYAAINPWVSSWATAENGRVLVSEQDFPARLLIRTEFYNDWMKPQDLDAAVGVKIDGGGRGLIHLPVHYPLSLAQVYDAPAAEVLRRVEGSLMRAITLASEIADRTEQAMSGAALVERTTCAAFVVDSAGRLRDANQQAVDLFSSGRIATAINQHVRFAHHEHNALFQRHLTELVRGPSSEACRTILRGAARAWHQLSMARLPQVAASAAGNPVANPGPLVLALLRSLDERPSRIGLAAFASRFSLTPAETKFCECLALGDTLAEYAHRLGIAKETARHRCKMVFEKTGTHSQRELASVILRLSDSH